MIFGTGRIYPKPGNEKVLVFAIDNRRSLREKVIPFLDKYLIMTGKNREYELFKKIVFALENKAHTTREGLIEIIKLAYEHQGKGKKRKRPLEQVINELSEATRPANLRDDIPALTPQEIRILQLITEGLDNGTIAEILSLSTNTIKSHVRNIFTKLGVSDRTQAAIWAIRRGLSA